MLTFIGPSKLTVNHKDGNKLNNNILNLEYLTAIENQKYSIENGLTECWKFKALNEYEKQLIRILRGVKRPTYIAKMFGVSYANIYRVWGPCSKRIDVVGPKYPYNGL